MKISQIRNRYFMLLDVVLLIITPFISIFLRLETLNLEARFILPLYTYIIISICTRLILFYLAGVYSCYWQEASIHEFVSSTIVIILSTIFLATLNLIFHTSQDTSSLTYLKGLPRSVPLIDGLLFIIIFWGVRLSSRIWEHLIVHKLPRHKGKNTLLIGAGNMARIVIKELVRKNKVFVCGFLDNTIAKNMRINGKPILGVVGDIATIVPKYKVEQVIICLPDATGTMIQNIIHSCQNFKVEIKIVPDIHKTMDCNEINIDQIRKINIEDLLRREPIQLNMSLVAEAIHGKTILITGAGGSIGSELARQIAIFAPKNIILLGHGENSIFLILEELQQKFPSIKTTPVIADIRFFEHIKKILCKYNPDIIFHAAAHKHVPLMEENYGEALHNNIIGSHNLLKACAQKNIAKFVLISSDKAVHPKNIMGATKRITELLMKTIASNYNLPYVAVRFGNILNSRGSVVQTFEQQIAKGLEITVTHPDMERYFMTIPEAVQLVLQAFTLGEKGEIFILDMGEPIKITDLAKDLIALHGLKVGEDVKIKYTGMRKGEKLQESLNYENESCIPTKFDKILCTQSNKDSTFKNIEEVVTHFHSLIETENREEILQYLKQLIPELAIVE